MDTLRLKSYNTDSQKRTKMFQDNFGAHSHRMLMLYWTIYTHVEKFTCL